MAKRDFKNVRVDLRLKVRREIDLEELINYIGEAVETWGGQRRPDDTLFYGVAVQKASAIARGDRQDFTFSKPLEIEPWGGEDSSYDA